MIVKPEMTKDHKKLLGRYMDECQRVRDLEATIIKMRKTVLILHACCFVFLIAVGVSLL